MEVILDGTLGSIGDPHTSWFNELDGAYNFADDSNFSYAGHVFDDDYGPKVHRMFYND